MVEYRTSAQAVFDIKYHLVWITKYRYKILRGRIAERARLQLRQICQARETVINTRCGGSRSDPHAGVGAAGYGASQVGAVSERAVIAEAPTRNSGTAQSATGGSTCGRGAIFCANVGAVERKRSRNTLRITIGTRRIKGSRSQRPPSLAPALSREPFRRL